MVFRGFHHRFHMQDTTRQSQIMRANDTSGDAEIIVIDIRRPLDLRHGNLGLIQLGNDRWIIINTGRILVQGHNRLTHPYGTGTHPDIQESKYRCAGPLASKDREQVLRTAGRQH